MNATYNTIADLRSAITSHGMPEDYVKKMLHTVPELPIVKDRAAYLVEKAKDRIVLDIGCTGKISKAIKAVAKKYYGIDQVATESVIEVDVDHRPDQIPVYEDVEIIIASEILEHLANPGYFLMALNQLYNGKLIYITVPNAGSYTVRDGCEMVNKDHVAWYSYTTLKTLLTRYGFTIEEARWYNGVPHKAEGLIFVVK